jgi:hypothetical protein
VPANACCSRLRRSGRTPERQRERRSAPRAVFGPPVWQVWCDMMVLRIRPRRPVEDHRVGAALLDRGPQRRALAQQVLLPDELVQAAGTHANGERARVATLTRRAARRRRGRGRRLGPLAEGRVVGGLGVEQALHGTSIARTEHRSRARTSRGRAHPTDAARRRLGHVRNIASKSRPSAPAAE